MTTRRLCLLLVATLTASGCWGGRLPAREMYRLRLPSEVGPALPASGPAVSPLEGSLAITPYETPGLYDEHGIVFRIGQNEYGAYPNREWAVPLGEMLGMMTEDVLSRVPLTVEPARYDPPSRRSKTFLWRGAVREFEEVNRDGKVLVAVHLDASLTRSLDDSVVWSGSARREREVPRPTMDEIVRALSELAAEAIAELSRNAAVAVKGTSASTARSVP